MQPSRCNVLTYARKKEMFPLFKGDVSTMNGLLRLMTACDVWSAAMS